MTNLKLHHSLRNNSDEYKYYSGDNGEVVKVELYYWREASRNRPRGIYLRMSTVNREQHDGYRTESFMLFQDRAIMVLLLALPRKNDRALTAFALRLDPILPELVAAYLTDRDAAKALIQTKVAA